jgi:hypothetical protein
MKIKLGNTSDYESPDARHIGWLVADLVVLIALWVCLFISVVTESWAEAGVVVGIIIANALHDIYLEVRATRRLAEISLRAKVSAR